MLGLADGKIDPTPSVRKHLDLCLDCRGCETACPSGVVYHELLEETRGKLAAGASLTITDRLMRWLFFSVFTHVLRLKLALLPARLLQKLGIYRLLRRLGIMRLLGPQLGKMEQMLPTRGRLWPRWPRVRPSRIGAAARESSAAQALKDAIPSPPANVSFFAGCIGAVLADRVNQIALDLLADCGANVSVPPRQGCCGAIHLHGGAKSQAKEMARRNIDAMPDSSSAADLIVSTAAGCGAMLREYGVLLRDDPAYAERARRFSARVRDISEALLELGPPPMPHAIPLVATYHDACHLAHAQKVTAAPRALLAKVHELKLIPLGESDLCCGAAGTYNLTQPLMSSTLAGRKLSNILATGANVCLSGNIGCTLQIQSAADTAGMKLRVLHPVEVLYLAVRGE